MIPLKDSHPAGIFPFWTLAIIAANIYVFFLELTSPNPDFFIAAYALIPAKVDFSQFAGIDGFVTSQFLHAGFLHIASNMLFLWVFGDNVEGKFGFFLFPLIYLISGVVGGLAQYVLAPDLAVPMLGASGAVAGVLGAYYKLFPHHTIKTLVPVFGFISVIEVPAGVMLIYWFITQIFSGVATVSAGALELGGVAWFAHIGGFLTGYLLAVKTKPHKEQVAT